MSQKCMRLLVFAVRFCMCVACVFECMRESVYVRVFKHVCLCVCVCVNSAM